jgi:hypothetical protein
MNELYIINTMAHLTFHNDTVSLNHLWYESQKNLIATVCIKLGQHDKIAELSHALLGDPLKIKPMKDPAKPKRPTSGYLYFCEDARPKLMKRMRGKKNKKVKLGDIAKELGAMWKDLTDENKIVYVEKSKKDKERYLDEMEKYNANH